MANELCMRCFNVKGKYSVCPFCGYEDGTPPDKEYYLVPGTILSGHFIVGTVTGLDNYGITYKSYDMTLGVIVAVREFYPQGLVRRKPGQGMLELLAGSSQVQYRSQMKRFLMEAQSVAGFGKTKDIVNVYDYFEQNNTAYIIMEYVDDDLLSRRLGEGKFPPDEAFLITERIIEAVKKIHAQGIIHRNLNPGNIFISLDNMVKISGFGAAYLNDSPEGSQGSISQAPGYMPPEQLHRSAKQGYFTDLYYIGALYYHMLTGVKPDDAGKREIKDELKSPLELGIRIDENTDRAVMEALALQPGMRFQGIQQLDDALHGKRAAEYPKDKIKRHKRKRNWISACISLVVIAFATGAVFLTRYYNRENIMFDTKVTKDTVVIWVDDEDSREALESVKSELVVINPGDSDAVKQMKKENEGVIFEIRDITKEHDGYTNKYPGMDEALQAAVYGKEEFPDVFLSDNVSDIGKYDLVSYKDNVYQNINTDDYLYFSGYDKYYPDMEEMPLSFDILLFYAIDSEDSSLTETFRKQLKKKKIVPSSLFDAVSDDGTIELSDIFEANSNGKEHTYFDGTSAVLASILYDGRSFDNYNGVFDFSGQFAGTLSQCLKIRADSEKTAKWKADAGMYGNSILAGSGYRSRLFEAKLENNSIPYKVYVPVADGKMLVQYKMKLAVSAKSGRNKQIAAMRFVYFALGQQQCAVDKDTAYPVSDVMLQGTKEKISTFDEFFEINNTQDIVRELVKEKRFPCLLLAKGSGTIAEFAEDLPEKESLLDESNIEIYCNGFMSD